MPNPPSSSLHLHLKNGTDTIHQALHRDPLLGRLTDRQCTLDDYRTVLRVFYAFYSRNEGRVHCPPQLKFPGEAPVLAWLKEDLTALEGVACPTITGENPDGDISDLSRYLGYLYVKQGSTLGGQVLCRHLQNTLGLAPTNGLRFFYGYGEQTRRHWLELQAYLAIHQDAADIPSAVASAQAHFHQLQKELQDAQLSAIAPIS